MKSKPNANLAIGVLPSLLLVCSSWVGCQAPARSPHHAEPAASPTVVWYLSGTAPRQGVNVPFKMEDGATAYRSETPLLDQSSIVGTQVVVSTEPGSVSLVALLDERGQAALAGARSDSASISVASYLDGTLALGCAIVNKPERMLPICRVRGEQQASRREMEALAARFARMKDPSPSGK